MNSQKNQQPNSGAILILTLIIIAAVVAMAIEIYVITQNMARRQTLSLELSRLQVLASDAAFQMLERLANDENLLCDHTNESWAIPYTNLLSDGTKIYAYVIDENRFFDVNNLAVREDSKIRRNPLNIVIELLTINGFKNSISLAESMKDWVDIDTESAQELSQEHTNALLPNLPMEGVSEMAFIFATHSTPFENIPYGLTLLPKEKPQYSKININTAPDRVLISVLGSDYSDLVLNICKRREAAPIQTLAEVVPAKFINEARTLLDVKSEHFSIFAEATKDGRMANVYALAYRQPDGTITILRWVE